jgi:DNA-binding transcriptional LysR family regulator
MQTISITNITLGQLRVLVAVVDQGGFTAAASALGMTQSGASQALQTLEDSVGVTLLTRGRDGIAPTEAGAQVLPEARAALQAVERLRAHCAGFAGLAKGTLRIASVTSSATRLLPDRLRTFRTRYPGIDIVLLEGTDDEVCDWVHAGVADLGLSAAAAPDLHGEAVLRDEFVAVLPHRHPLARAGALTLAVLSKQPFIMSGAGCEPMIRGFFAEAGCTPRIVFTVRDMATLFEMVRQRLGVTIVPSLSLPDSRAHLRVVPLSPRCSRTLLAVTRADQTRLPAVEAFLRDLRPADPLSAPANRARHPSRTPRRPE